MRLPAKLLSVIAAASGTSGHVKMVQANDVPDTSFLSTFERHLQENAYEATDGNRYSVLGWYDPSATTNDNSHCQSFWTLPSSWKVYEGEYNTPIMNELVAAGSWGGACICGAPYGGNFRCVTPTTGIYCGGGGYGTAEDADSGQGHDIAAKAAEGIGIRSNNCGMNVVLYSDAPVGTPSPTSSPTSTSSPTASPTSAATASAAAPWDIVFLDLVANFTLSSEEELTLNYEIGKDRVVETFLYQKDCATNITEDGLFALTDTRTPKNSTFDSLKLDYSVDKSAIGNSSIYTTFDSMELCQVVQLKEGTYVIAEDKREILIDFDLRANFATATDLGPATINDAEGDVDFDESISACKCEGISFDCNSDALLPNEDLKICIKSLQADIKLNKLNSLVLSQAGADDFAVIESDTIVIQSITSREYVASENGVVATTRVPVNVFDFETSGSILDIAGDVVLTLGSGGRKLKQAINVGSKTNDASEEAAFDIEVRLHSKVIEEEEALILNSAANFAISKGLVASAAMVLACIYHMW